jgi:hypothetical protein
MLKLFGLGGFKTASGKELTRMAQNLLVGDTWNGDMEIH